MGGGEQVGGSQCELGIGAAEHVAQQRSAVFPGSDRLVEGGDAHVTVAVRHQRCGDGQAVGGPEERRDPEGAETIAGRALRCHVEGMELELSPGPLDVCVFEVACDDSVVLILDVHERDHTAGQ